MAGASGAGRSGDEIFYSDGCAGEAFSVGGSPRGIDLPARPALQADTLLGMKADELAPI